MIKRFSQYLDNCSTPDYLFFFPGQVAFFCGLTYTGIVIINITHIVAISPLDGMVYFLLAVGINKLTTPFFSRCFQPIAHDTLTLKAYKFVKWSFSLLSAKLICALFGVTITMSQVIWIGIAYFLALRIAKFIISKLRRSINAPTISEIPMRNFRKR